MTAALVTGGARRIGRALCLGLAAKGHDIYLHYHASTDEAEGVADEVRGLGRACRSIHADLSDADAAARLIAACTQLGPITHLVNNAAVYAGDPADGFSPAHFDRQIAVNLRAPLILADAFARQAGAGASIVNILDSRVAALPGRFVSYMAAKSGLAAATEMLALKYAPAVRVNAVAPGPVLDSAGESVAEIASFQARTPLAVVIDMDDIVDAARYLIAARAVTGQILYVDGGHRFTSRRYV